METSSSSVLSLSSGNHNKRGREADLAAVEGGSLEADAKRLRPEDLLDMFDDDTDAAAAGDLASVMRSLEEEIAAGDVVAPQPELGFLLEASDDELGLPPAGGATSDSSEDAGAAEPDGIVGFGGQIWGFEDEIDGGDDGFDAGLFGFGDESCGPSDLAVLRQETV